MSEKFTPGPWHLVNDKVGPRIIGGGRGVAIIDQRSMFYDDEDQTEGNADLIAAAPDLYAALQLLVESGVTRYHLNTGYAKAALAKAIGQKK